MQITKPGIYDSVPMDAYIADPCPDPSLSRGTIERLVMRSPAHAYHEHPRLGGGSRSSSAAADLGSAAHGMLLGGAERIVWVDAKNWMTKAAKEKRDEARARNLIPMLERKREPLESMVAVAYRKLRELGAGFDGRREHTVCWLDGGDVWCRARPDWMDTNNGLIIDYKTTENADPDAFIRNMITNGYDIQAEWYVRGLSAIESPSRFSFTFVFLVQETAPPYLCSVIGVGEQMTEMAKEKIAAGLKLWRHCRRENKWPGYHPDVHYAEPPSWAQWDWEQRRPMVEAGS